MGAKFGPAIAEPPRKGSAQILRSWPRKFQGWSRKPQPALLEMATVAPTRLRRVTELEIGTIKVIINCFTLARFTHVYPSKKSHNHTTLQIYSGSALAPLRLRN